MDIKITPEDVEKLVRETLLKSALGNTIQTAVNKALGEPYNNPVQNAVIGYISTVARAVVEEQYAAQIRTAVEEAVRARLTDEVAKQFVNTTFDRMERFFRDG